MREVLAVHALAHHYGDKPTFQKISLAIAEGTITAVLGPSGCGKTTLLRCIAGFETPSAGEIHLKDKLLSSHGKTLVQPEHRKIGILFQDYALFPHLSVMQNVSFGAKHTSADESPRKWLDRVGLAALAERMPQALSGGQQQRVALARALAANPQVLLLDEPFANVDASRRAVLVAAMKAQLKQERVATLLVTHDREEALGLADQVAVMLESPAGGQIVQFGPPEEVYRRPISEEIAFLTGEAFWVSALASGLRAECELGTLSLQQPHSGKIRCLIRPESVEFIPAENGQLEVEAQVYLGRAWRLDLKSPLGKILVESKVDLAAGTKGNIRVTSPLWAIPNE